MLLRRGLGARAARGAAVGCSALAAAAAASTSPSPAEAQASPSASGAGDGYSAKVAAATVTEEPMFGFLPEAVRQPFEYAWDVVYENVVAPYAEPSRAKLLPDLPASAVGREKPTLVVSLNGTLIESEWTRQYGWRYVKRPGVDVFLAQLSQYYELVLWTECLNSCEHIIDKLDPLPPPKRAFRHKLYRDATFYTGGLHRKDLRALNRDPDKVIVVGCDPYEYSLQPEHGIALTEYKAANDPNREDTQLKRLLPFLQYCAIGLGVGSVKSISEELKALEVDTKLSDGGEAFERAVQARFADLKKRGLMPVADRRGRFTAGPGVGGGGGGSTLWTRMGIAKS